ncbi:MAG TPA: Ku protein [Pirellulales bacterium]
MAARYSWKGYLRLSLVTVPVQAVNAVTSGEWNVHLRQLHAVCKTPIRYQKVCPIHGEVSNDEIVMGYEEQKGHFVLVEKEELKDIKEKSEKTITIDTFVSPDTIDPMEYEGRTYYLVPDGAIGQKPYAVLMKGLEANNVFVIGRWILFSREHLILVRAMDGLLGMEVLHFHSDFRDKQSITSDLHLPTVTKEELKLASKLIEASTAEEFDITKYEDTYDERLKQLIEAKRGKREVAVAEEVEEAPVINLMDALRRSVAQSRESGTAGTKRPRAAKPSRRATGRRAS